MRLDPRGVFLGAIGIVLMVTVTTSVIIPTVFSVNTSGWGTAETALWSIVGLVVVGGIVYALYALFF